MCINCTHPNSLTHTPPPTPHTQTYRMHLKSRRGAIDVLVCPEDEVETLSLESPNPPPHLICCASNGLDMSTPAPDSFTDSVLDQSNHSLSDLLLSEPQLDCSCHHNPSMLLHQTSCTELNVGHQMDQCGVTNEDTIRAMGSLSSYSLLEPASSNDLEISLSSAADVDCDHFEGLMDHLNHLNNSTLLPLDMFEHLSPSRENEEFSFSIDDSDEGLPDLFEMQ